MHSHGQNVNTTQYNAILCDYTTNLKTTTELNQHLSDTVSTKTKSFLDVGFVARLVLDYNVYV